jgi:hypothetical protein
MSGSGLFRAMWKFIDFRFDNPALDKYESKRFDSVYAENNEGLLIFPAEPNRDPELFLTEDGEIGHDYSLSRFHQIVDWLFSFQLPDDPINAFSLGNQFDNIIGIIF